MAMAEMKHEILFTGDHIVQDHRVGTKDAEKYVEGKKYKLPALSALHFVRIGKAEYTDADAAN